MRPAVPLALLALAACGGRDDGAGTKVDANQIERLSQPKEEPKAADLQISARPQPLTGADLRGAGMSDPPRCDFSSDGHRLFAAQGGDAIAKIENLLRHFDQPSPASATGTFVTDRQFSISVGRTDVIDPGGTGDDRWPARLTATNRRTRARVELSGTWRCGAG
jgi:hypothetical protein